MPDSPDQIDVPPPDKTLYIIDGFAQIFRAYYAIMGGMSSPNTGEPTGATFGMAAMLIKLFRDFNPSHVVMAIDTPGKTFRDEIYPEYKATRDPAPEDLTKQIPRIFEMTKLFGVPVIGFEGAEADDVIATITNNVLHDPARDGLQVRIVSKDKDLEQLLGDRVAMIDIHKDEIIDVEALKENKGIHPDQVIDLLTLMGDTSDNIPGVEGVGPKTAAKLLQEYETLDGVFEAIDKIKGKRKERLLEAKEHLPLSKQLVTLRDDLELDFTFDDAIVGAIDATALRALFKELGFRRHASDLEALIESDTSAITESAAPAGVPEGGLFAEVAAAEAEATLSANNLSSAGDNDYRTITDRDALEQLVETLRRQAIISVDTETIGLSHRAGLCGICLAWTEGEGVYIPTRSPNPDEHLDEQTVLDALRPVFADPALPKCGHNLKYDALVLRHAGVELNGIAFDTMIASHLVGEASHGLDALAEHLLNYKTISISKLIGPRERGKKQKTMDQVPLEQITTYAAEDADITLRLYHELAPRIRAMGLESLATQIEMPLVEVLAEMEFNGIRIDTDVLAEQKKELTAKIDLLRDQIYEKAGGPFNIDSPKQLGDVLFNQMKMPVIKKTKTGYSTDVEVLEKLAEREDIDPAHAAFPPLVLEYRQFTKLVGTYLDSLTEAIDEKTGRIHASFHQTGAATGRLSSSGPNLQNIPIRTDVGRQIRKAFIAEPNHLLICADYSQIELRVLAHLSDDAGLVEAFKADMDIHAAVASRVFGVEPEDVTSEQRARAKVINFGIIYGITPFGLARRIDNLDVNAAGELIDDYKERFPGIEAFMNRCVQNAIDHGFVETIMNRRRSIPQINARNPQTRALGERLAINSVVQGSAADLIKLAMVKLHQRAVKESLPLKMLLQIHDELVFETPQADAEVMKGIVEYEMENAMSLDVPLKVDANVGVSWFDAK